jgi:S1-C subfamily serine protease
MKTILSFLSAIIISGIATTKGAGIAVFKDQPFHADSSANPVVYKSLLMNNAPFVKLDTGTKQLTIDKKKLVAKIDIPDSIPLNLIKEADLAGLRKSHEEMVAFAKRFAKTAPTLTIPIDEVKANLDKFEGGQVRFSGNWISRADYDDLKMKHLAEVEGLRKQDEKIAEQRRMKRAEEEAFAANQREKGLEQYGGKWLPKEEVMRLRQRDIEIAQANESVSNKTIKDGVYSIFQVMEDGMLIRVVRGEVKQGGINTDLIFLSGAAKGTTADGDYYNGTLYWCGNYSYVSLSNIPMTVNAYCLDRRDAIERVRVAMNGESDSSSNGREEVASTGARGDSNLPEPLVGATSSGSGFFVGKQGYFITNAHVVEGGKKFSVYHSGRSLNAELIQVSKVADLALLKVTAAVPGIEIAEEEAEAGQDVFAVGYPNPEIQGIEVKVTKGVISSSKGFQDDATRYQIDAAVQPGNSGGPLCDSSGRLVGVVVSGLNQIAVASRTGSIPQNVNYAIKASEVNAILRQKSVSSDGSSKNDGVKSVTHATGLVIVR